MVDRPYKCPLCHSVFRNESGMKWHVFHRHEVAAALDALDALGKGHEAETASLKGVNSQLKQELEQLQVELSVIRVTLLAEKAEKLAALTRIQQLEQAGDNMILGLVVRDRLLKDHLNIELPNPLTQ